MTYKAIIVDDEKEARDILGILLKDFEMIHVVSIAQDADEAIDAIIKHNPDILFLDIDMPGKDGFDLVKMVNDYGLSPTIVFVTAFNQYAIKAIKFSAFDYLLKPVDVEELDHCIKKFICGAHKQDFNSQVKDLIYKLDPNNKIRFSNRTGFKMVDPEDILYCKADGNYSTIHYINGEEVVVTYNIGKIGELTEKHNFFRINRSVLINLCYLSEVNHKEKRCVVKGGGSELVFRITGRKMNELRLRC